MKTTEQRANRRTLAQAVKDEQRRIRTEALDKLRDQINLIRDRRKALTVKVRAQCHRARLRGRELRRRRREEARDALKRELQEMRQAERNRCQLRLERVKAESETARERAARELRERARAEQHASKLERHRDKHRREQQAREKRAESDDEVRANLEADLIPIFDKVRSRIRARPGMARTDAFLHWVEENPGEVWAMREDLAERKLAALIREEAAAAKALKKCGGRCRHQPARERRAALGEAPF